MLTKKDLTKIETIVSKDNIISIKKMQSIFTENKIDEVVSYCVDKGYRVIEDEDNNLESEFSVFLANLDCYSKKLSKQERNQLIIKAQNGDKDAKNTVVLANIRLVLYWAYIYKRFFTNCDVLDLFQEGCIGLMTAIDRYNTKGTVAFSTYATDWIRQGIRKFVELDRLVSIPQAFLLQMLKVRDAIVELRVTQSKEPSIKEIVDYCYKHNLVTKQYLSKKEGLTEHDVILMMQIDEKFSTMVSLDDLYFNTDDIREIKRVIDMVSSNKDETYLAVENADMKERLENAIKKYLTEREQRILKLRMGFGISRPLTLKEIAEKEHITGERVRMIEKTALRKLRKPSVLRSLQEYVE